MWPNPQFPVDLVTFTEEILNGKLHFLCSVFSSKRQIIEAMLKAWMFLIFLKENSHFYAKKDLK